MGPSEHDHNRLTRFVNLSPELVLGTVWVRGSGGKVVRAQVMASNGYLAAIEFNARPKELLAGSLTVTKVEMGPDPMTAVVEATPEIAPQPGPLLSRIGQSLSITRVSAPAAVQRIRTFVEDLALGAPPAELVGLLHETDGFWVGTWEFMGTRAPQLPLPDRQLWLLACDEESNAGICVEEGEVRGRLFLFSMLDSSLKEYPGSFSECLVHLMSNSPQSILEEIDKLD